MPLIKCPNCGLENDTDRRGVYCDDCGERLPVSIGLTPSPGPSDDYTDQPDDYRRRPNRAYDDDYPDVRKGGRSETQKQAAMQVANVLFIIAALQLICSTIAMFALPEAVGMQGAEPIEVAVAIGIIVAVCIFFVAMGVWAIYMPVPAGIVGLLAYIGLALLDMAAAPNMAMRGIVMKIIFVVILIRAIIAAGKAT